MIDQVKKGELKKNIADKVKLKKCAIENLPIDVGQFDSVCAYEIFEHLSEVYHKKEGIDDSVKTFMSGPLSNFEGGQ